MEIAMNEDLKYFWLGWARVVLMTLVPVVFVAFTSIPLSLGGHPGESMERAVISDGHMT
jgi:hypothetical protein